MKRLELKNLRLIDNLGLQKNSISDEFSTNRIRRNSSLWSNLKIWKRKKIKMKFFPGSHVKRVTDSIVSYLRRSLESEKLTLCLIIDSSWYRQLLSERRDHFLQTNNLSLCLTFLFLGRSYHFTILHYLLSKSVNLFLHLLNRVAALFKLSFKLLYFLFSF